MKKRLASWAVVLLLLACAMVLLFRPTKDSDISFANYQKLANGMTRQRVENILGGPAREEVRPTWWARTGVWPWEEWWGREGVIYVAFDADGRAWDIKFERHTTPPTPIEPTLVERVQSWLPW
jgi:hypothetical protein